MQEDVYQGDGLNLYAYCGNNPVKYYDPSGYSGSPQVYNVDCPNVTTNGDSGKDESEAIYGNQIEISEQKMYQQGQHYNKHGKEMGFGGKKDYEAGARAFIEENRNTAEIFEGTWISSRGNQSGELQIVIRFGGKQVIINKETGQIIDFYEGTSLNGFINIKQVQ